MTISSSQFPGLLCYCRAGFEKECAAELMEQARLLGGQGYVRSSPDSGYVLYCLQGADDVERFRRNLRHDDLIFARQLVFVTAQLALPAEDRITPLLEAVRVIGVRFSEVFLETADTNEAKSLSVFLRKFATPFRQALQRSQLLGGSHHSRLHVFFVNSAIAYVGVSYPGNSSSWEMGIPRLRFPREAPSRSTLKLEEAFGLFVRDPENDLKPAMTAVDLGAAPGGWTWQLVRRHIRTVAVDNGPISPALLESGIVQHLRVDGFRYRPPRPVDWLVCDMVEQPGRIAALVADWLAEGWCRHAIFNLKLPMKKRYEAVLECRQIMEERLASSPADHELAFRQLYHDRAEITGYASRR